MEAATPALGQAVDVTYHALYIVLSYFVSIVGSLTTLELLHRRTSSHGCYNWYLLIAAATAMGAVSIWSMHYIGNRALVMTNGPEIVYRPGYTAGSFFLPISLVGSAFYAFGISETVNILWTITGGVLVGASVCGMHYISQQGIANYTLQYSVAYVVGAAVIAVAASTIAMGIFFYLTVMWTNSGPRRLACAALLAAAVSGMHWSATVGTSYRVKIEAKTGGAGLSGETTALMVLFLSLGCCIALMAFAIFGRRSKTQSATRAQQVVLASATFDENGRILVTSEGLLPCRKITDSYRERTFDDTFDTGHLIFCWILRLSHCWPAVVDLVPGMRRNVRSGREGKTSRPGTAATSSDFGIGDEIEDYDTYFKQLFCVAAKDLADSISASLENIGILFGEILSTGTTSKSTGLKVFPNWKRCESSSLSTAERGNSLFSFGRGQLLVLVRRISDEDAGKLLANGYRFAAIPHIVDYLARSMEVTRQELLPKLNRMRDSAGTEMLLEAGVHLACFAVRPVFRKGFDILVRKDAKGLLPTVQLPGWKLNKCQFNFLQRLDGVTVATCLNKLRRKSISSSKEEEQFCRQFFDALSQLTVQLGDSFFQEAKLTARVLVAPCPQIGSGPRLEYASVIAFRVITDVHSVGNIDPRFEYVPANLFLSQQRVYQGSSYNESFARSVLADFGEKVLRADSEARSLISRQGSFYRPSSSGQSIRPNHTPPFTSTRHWPFPIRGSNGVLDNVSSQKSLVNFDSNAASADLSTDAIHFTQEINVEVNEIHQANIPDIEMTDLSGYGESISKRIEKQTFAEELLALTIGERKKSRQVAQQVWTQL